MCEGSENSCRGPCNVVAAVAGGVDNVYSGRERDEAFFQPSGFLVVPVVEGGRVRDRLEVLTLRGDKIAARGDQGVNVADCVEGLSGDGADLVSAETDELGERSARFAFFDDRVERRARVVHLGNVPVRVDVRTVDVLSVAVPRRTLLVDVSDEVGAPEHERGQVIARMVVDLNCENAVVGDATGGLR